MDAVRAGFSDTYPVNLFPCNSLKWQQPRKQGPDPNAQDRQFRFVKLDHMLKLVARSWHVRPHADDTKCNESIRMHMEPCRSLEFRQTIL
eukprot:225330-Prorocentrum_minimum.AAC.1